MTHAIPCLFALCFVSALSLGCKHTPPVEKEPPHAAVPVTELTSSPAPSASAAEDDTIPTPTLVAEKFAPGGTSPSEVYAIEGGIAVTEGIRVGLVTGEAIRWVGSIPKVSGFGKGTIISVVGRAPDLVAAVYTGGKGRIPQPVFQLLTGKKESVVGFNRMRGPARVGETVFVETDMDSGPQIVRVHGPPLERHLTAPPEDHCQWGQGRREPAVLPEALESTPAGTMISLGTDCEKRGEVAEVWEKDAKSRIVDLGRWWKKGSYESWLLKGEGDELFACPGGWNAVVLRYKDGEFSALPDLERPIEDAFVSPRGQLHASHGKVVYRFESGKWAPAWILPAGVRVHSLALDTQGTLWASGGGSVYRLRPGPTAPLPTGECPTPFVYLRAARHDEGTTYRATRKALAAFPEAASLGLVEFGSKYWRQVGVTVKSRAQGQALVAHLATAMKDEDPHYFCYEPYDVRRIPLDAPEKP